MYTPDCWVLVKIGYSTGEAFYKVLAGWSGSYLNGDSWRMNSGITTVEDDGDYWNFAGESGSVYRCHKAGNEMRASIAYIWYQLQERYGEKVSLVDVDEVIKGVSPIDRGTGL